MRKKIMTPAELESLRGALRLAVPPDRKIVSVCSGTGCQAARSRELADALTAAIGNQGLGESAVVRRTGCYGFCERGPVVVVQPDGIAYFKVTAKDAGEIVEQTLAKGRPVRRLLYHDPKSKAAIERLNDIPFYEGQLRLLLEDNARIDPRSIDDYLAIGGYGALAKVLAGRAPGDVIDEIKASGLRGRGGGGFPTGKKWASVARAAGPRKYVIVNGDEGDPGAFMDRSLLEGNPHRVIEGLLIGAFAVGAQEGFIYVRQEYPLAVENVRLAIGQAEELGLIGKNILGSGFDFTIAIHCGAGAFVSGESSALMNAIEGRVGEPRPKYVHTAECGLWGRPTCLNNVETWANVPLIVERGAAWFAKIGTPGSKGTKVFSLVGRINNGGLVEVPMGTTLRQLVFDIGGGIPGGKVFKAVQTGGPSGGLLTAAQLDLGVDFDELERHGSMMGSGGIIVMDEDTCMVDVARYYTEFLAGESCGKCVPCREGLRQMRKILNRITHGEGKPSDIGLLEELGELMGTASLCALGKTAANPVLGALKWFKPEFMAHIVERRCPAGVCAPLIRFVIDPKACVGCGICAKGCPVGAIHETGRKQFVIDQNACVKCRVCFEKCPSKNRAVGLLPAEQPIPVSRSAR